MERNDTYCYFLSKYTIDRSLQDNFPNVSKTRLSKWRRDQPLRNITLDQLIEKCRLAQLPETGHKYHRKGLGDGGGANYVGGGAEEGTVLSLPDTFTDIVGLEYRECCVCFSNFNLGDTLHCSNCEDHIVCRNCFRKYCTENVQCCSMEMIKCLVCQSYYDPLVAIVNLPATVVELLQKRQNELDAKVAVSAGNVVGKLHCKCGVIGVVEEKDLGNGFVRCFCGLQYCVKCGDMAHSDRFCQTSEEKVIEWIKEKGAKNCPNCGEAIEKNSGCNHLTCRKPGGCGHEFCWICLQAWNKRTCRH